MNKGVFDTEITDKQRSFCVSESAKYSEFDSYVANVCASPVWSCPFKNAPSSNELLPFLQNVWDAYHRSIRDICKDAGLSQRKLAERFCIPYRTVEDWCRGLRKPPDYLRMMIQAMLGMF